MNYKLPFLKILAVAALFAWTNKAELLKAISVPTLAMVLVWGVWFSFSDALPPYLPWVLLLGYGLGFSFLAVACHRLILVGDVDRGKPFKGKPGYRELRFLAWVIVIYAIQSILDAVVQLPVQYLNGDFPAGGGESNSYWIRLVSSIPALYVLARLSLAFPAAAIDRHSGPRWSWIRTRGNGWRIFVVVGLFPWLMGTLIKVIWREEATVAEQVVLSILAYIWLAIAIIALSFTYKDLAKQYAHAEQSTSVREAMLATAAEDSFHEIAQDGKGYKLYAAMKVFAVFAMAYLLVGSLASYFVDCSSELISEATSPGGTYKAELLNQTCKSNREQGVTLRIAKTAPPRTMNSYTVSKTPSREVDLVWTSDGSLRVRHTRSLDLAEESIMIDEVRVVFEK